MNRKRVCVLYCVLLICGCTSVAAPAAPGSVSILHSFTYNDSVHGYGPTGNLAISGSTLYGLVGQGGVAGIYKINNDGSGYAVLHTLEMGRLPLMRR
jgi:hypothetical protein